jgi:hypothetical protein
MWAFIYSISALPPNYTLVEQNENCRYYAGPVRESGSLPIRAECHWKEISLQKLDSFLGDYEGQTETYSNVTETKVVRREKERTWVYQIHKDRRMSPREGLIMYERTQIENRIIHRWRLSDTQPTPKENHLPIEEHQGEWVLETHPMGGVNIKYESSYLPGGSIPAWLVRQFQTSEVIKILEETHKGML